jgi:hypothetical protein
VCKRAQRASSAADVGDSPWTRFRTRTARPRLQSSHCSRPNRGAAVVSDGDDGEGGMDDVFDFVAVSVGV